MSKYVWYMHERAHTRTCMYIYKANSGKHFFLNCPPFCFTRHGLPLKVRFSNLATLVATKTTVDLPVAPPTPLPLYLQHCYSWLLPGLWRSKIRFPGLCCKIPARSAEESPQHQVNDFYSNKI